jgi:hypothetical protein
MEFVVYVLCALASFLCASLLVRGYKRNPTRLLLWSAVCFAGLAVNNVILCVDFSLGDIADLTVLRHLSAVISLGALMYGLIWEVA